MQQKDTCSRLRSEERSKNYKTPLRLLLANSRSQGQLELPQRFNEPKQQAETQKQNSQVNFESDKKCCDKQQAQIVHVPGRLKVITLSEVSANIKTFKTPQKTQRKGSFLHSFVSIQNQDTPAVFTESSVESTEERKGETIATTHASCEKSPTLSFLQRQRSPIKPFNHENTSTTSH